MIFLFAIASATPLHKNAHAESRLVVGENTLVAGRDVVDAGLQFIVRPGWHVYWKNSGDAGFPPAVIVDDSGDVAEAELLWPAPKRFVLRGGLQAFGYADDITYPLRLILKKPARGAVNLKLAVDYLVCEEECVPYTEHFALEVKVGPQDVPDARSHAQLERARASVPVTSSKIEARVEASELVVTGVGDDAFFETHPLFDVGTPKKTDTGFVAPLKAKTMDPLPASTTFAITLTGAMPRERVVSVELPPAKPVEGASASAPIVEASFWLMLLFGVLGGVILNLMPCVLPVLSLKLLGLVEHESEKDARLGALWSTAGILTSFVLLALAVLALRLAGWGAQFQEPRFVAFLALVVTGFALNLWGVFEVPLPSFLGGLAGVGGRRGPIAHFSAGLFATLLATPCSAPFLGTAIAFALQSSPVVVVTMFFAVGVGMSMPYLALAAWPRLVHLLPKPGAWMLRLKQGLGFALAATAVWLLFVLAGQIDQTRVAFVQLGLLALAALLVLVKHRLVWALTLGVAATTIAIAKEDPPSGDWQPFDEAKLTALEAAGRPVFLDVTADWCFTCKVNERVVLASDTVKQAFAKCGITPMKADWTKRDARIGAFLAAHGRTGIPFYLVHGHVLPELLTEHIVLDAIKGETKCSL